MPLKVQLVTDSAQVEPGSSVAVAVEVTHQGSETDHVEIAVEGVDPEWVAVPVPAYVIEPGETRTERLFLKPPRESHSSAGNYPFVVRVRSLETAETHSVQGVLLVKPYHHLSVDVQPRKAVVSPLSRETVFQVTVINLGNSDQTLQLFASDVDELFAYEFADEQLTLQPGQQKAVNLTATAAKTAFLASSRLQALTITARSVPNPSVSATSQAQIEQRALVSPGIAAFLVVGALAVAGYVAMIPKPPSIRSFMVDRARAMAGDEVTFKWTTANAESVELQIGTKRIEPLPADGSYAYTVSKDDDGKPVDLIAVSESRRSKESPLVLHVDVPAVIPLPTVESFEVHPTSVRLGDVFQVSYKLGASVTEATLSPDGIKLDPKADGVKVPANLEGSFNYKIIAQNKDGKSVESKAVTVTVKKISKANIIAFNASQSEVDPGTSVTLTWQVTNAVAQQIKVGNGEPVNLAAASGSQDLVVNSDTTVLLIAFDSDGVRTTQKVSIKVKQPAVPDDKTSEPPAGSTGGGLETTGGTAGGPPVGTGGGH